MAQEEKQEGSLIKLLGSTKNQVMKERANQLMMAIHTNFKGKIDGVFQEIQNLEADLTASLHKLVPTNQLETAFNVNPVDFVDKYIITLGTINKKEEIYERLRVEYFKLFGREYEEPQSFIV